MTMVLTIILLLCMCYSSYMLGCTKTHLKFTRGFRSICLTKTSALLEEMKEKVDNKKEEELLRTHELSIKIGARNEMTEELFEIMGIN